MMRAVLLVILISASTAFAFHFHGVVGKKGIRHRSSGRSISLHDINKNKNPSSPPKIVAPEELPTIMPQVFQMATQYFSGQAVYALIRLGIFDVLGSATMTTAELMERLPANRNLQGDQVVAAQKEPLERILRYVATSTPFLELSDATTTTTSASTSSTSPNENEYAFSLTLAGALLQTNHQPYVGCMIEHFHEKGMWNAWGELSEFVMGKTDSKYPFFAANGMPIFEWYAKNADTAGRPFNQAMKVFSSGVEQAIADSYDWKQFEGKTVVDVGGSHGLVVGAIKKAHPGVHCVNFDLPEVLNSIPEDNKIKGVDYVAGDIFDPSTFPPNCDAIYMKAILHDWSDENCVKILKSCHQVLPNDGTVIVSDAVVPSSSKEIQDKPEHSARVFMVDMIMLMIDGKERTRTHWESLVDAGGFVIAEIAVDNPDPCPPFITLKKK